MGCNCGGGGGTVTYRYIFVDDKGAQHEYGTEVEAKAAQIRAGNVGSIRTEPK